MQILKIYEFLELQKSYPYSFLRKSPQLDKSKQHYYYVFKADDKITYMVQLTIIDNSYINVGWASQDDVEHYSDDIELKHDKNMNINTLFKILNTIFKILYEFIETVKIKKCRITARVKNKYKVYKQIISEEPDFEIVKDYEYDSKDGKHYWVIDFVKL